MNMFPESYNPFNSRSSSRSRNPFSSSYYGRRRQQERKAAIELERENIRRQQIDEDRRRKAEYERRLRRQLEEEEIAKHQQQQRVQQYRRQEAINRLQMEEKRRKKAEYEKQQREAAEEMLREDQQRRDMLQRRKQEQQRSVRTSTTYPKSSVVRGPDGRLYRVSEQPNAHTRWNYDDDESSRTCSETSSSSMSEEEEETHDVDMNEDTANDEFTYTPDSSNSSSLQYTGRIWDNDAKSLKPLGVEVEIEDVPDEEDDELRDLHSVWRNRVPSHGQWMEPIDLPDK